ncbi:2-hydroxyacid dehydrogenase [Nocardia sp. NBC_00403]|uniref:2-hydroxyacid dehydrogenase n=1 Tax=Nocardia sp. NBC_00403 TaxID=2975990 RepID=UPI002E1D5CF5
MSVTVLVPDENGRRVLSQLAGVRALRFDPGEPLPDGAGDAEVLVPRFLARTAEMIDLMHDLPNLRLVQLLTAGAEDWIGRLPDGVMLSNGRGAHGGSVAEWVLGVLLTIYWDLTDFVDAQRDRRWAHHRTDGLQGKRILVIGAGDLGRTLQQRLEVFDTTVTLVGTVARGHVRGVAELPELLGECDVVVLMVPVTAETVGMVDAKFLARMTDGAVLVNAARGPVVDTEALLAELSSGRLCAALDVTDPEPLPSDHPLWTAPGLLLTPHIGGSSRGNFDRAYAIAAEEITRYVAGERPKNLVLGQY